MKEITISLADKTANQLPETTYAKLKETNIITVPANELLQNPELIFGIGTTKYLLYADHNRWLAFRKVCLTPLSECPAFKHWVEQGLVAGLHIEDIGYNYYNGDDKLRFYFSCNMKPDEDAELQDQRALVEQAIKDCNECKLCQTPVYKRLQSK